MTQLTVRLPETLVREVDDVAERLHASRSDLIRKALEQYLHRLASEGDAAVYARSPLTEAELALADDPLGWNPTPQW